MLATDQPERKIGKLKVLFYILFLLTGFWATAQNAFVDVALSAATVTDNDQFTYKITTNCDCNIEAPDLSDFDILQKQPGQFHSSQSINGVTKSSCTSTLTFVLRAKKKGKFNIGEAIVHCKNKKNRQSEQVSVEVVDAQAAFKEKEGKDEFYCRGAIHC